MPKIHCPKCNQEYELDESIVGCSVQCAVCDTKFVAKLPDNLEDIQDITGDSGTTSAVGDADNKPVKCPHCNKENAAKTAYCIFCGKKLTAPTNCPFCNAALVNGASFCPSCGMPVKRTNKNDKKKRKGCRRVFLIVLSVFLTVCIVFAVIAFAALNASSNAEKNMALAMTQIKMLDDALQQYKLDVGVYPSDLYCLVENINQVKKWDGPYIVPGVPKDPWGSEYQYLIPGEYDEYDLYSFGADKRNGGAGKNSDLSQHPDVIYSMPLGWRERMIAESKGELDMSKKRELYNKKIILPDNLLFAQMAAQEADGQQYDKLRRAGYSPEQITNYVMREKYLPLVRYAIGKLNITGHEKMTDEQMATIKKEMVKRQLRGVEKNLKKVDSTTGLSNMSYTDVKYTKTYEEALSRIWDARINAIRNGKDPNKIEEKYPDVIKNNPAMANAVTSASQNSW